MIFIKIWWMAVPMGVVLQRNFKNFTSNLLVLRII